MIRTADAAGADAVVFTGACVDPYNGKCVRATAGSLFHVPIVLGGPVEPAGDRLAGAGLAVLAADGAGRRRPRRRARCGTAWTATAWLFGNEAYGLPGDARALADAVIRVPIHGRAESLNLASAAAVCLYASARAHLGRTAHTRLPRRLPRLPATRLEGRSDVGAQPVVRPRGGHAAASDEIARMVDEALRRHRRRRRDLDCCTPRSTSPTATAPPLALANREIGACRPPPRRPTPASASEPPAAPCETPSRSAGRSSRPSATLASWSRRPST